MKRRFLLVFVAALLSGYVVFLGVLTFSNSRLQAFRHVQSQSMGLLFDWNQFESVTKELFITYDLVGTKMRWNELRNKFEKDFATFLDSPYTKALMTRDHDFRLNIEILQSYWIAKAKRLSKVNLQLTSYLKVDRDAPQHGNLLVTFGVNLAADNHSSDLLNILGELRWASTSSDYIFNKVLAELNQNVLRTVESQSQRLRLNALLIAILIPMLVIFVLLFRSVALAHSREVLSRSAHELSREVEVRKQTEMMLRSERDKLRSVLNAMGNGMYIVDRDYRIEFQNEVMGRHFGAVGDERCFEKYGKSDHPCTFCMAAKTLGSCRLHQSETIMDNGHNYELLFSPFTDADNEIKVVVLLSDVTERKKIEAESARTAHLASIGELAAGVAHEINNPIANMISLAEVIHDELQEQDADAHIPEIIINEGERVAEIIRNLLSFARCQHQEDMNVSIHRIIDNTFGFIQRQLEEDGIQVVQQIAPDIPNINIRPREIQQVFLNIVSNARYALNKKFECPNPEKKLFISIGEHNAESECFLRICFHDTGVGIPMEVLPKLGHPFFSTKPEGEGTGLGLSISHGIIKNHGGHLHFESVAGEYTKVYVDLPVSNKKETIMDESV